MSIYPLSILTIPWPNQCTAIVPALTQRAVLGLSPGQRGQRLSAFFRARPQRGLKCSIQALHVETMCMYLKKKNGYIIYSNVYMYMI